MGERENSTSITEIRICHISKSSLELGKHKRSRGVVHIFRTAAHMHQFCSRVFIDVLYMCFVQKVLTPQDNLATTVEWSTMCVFLNGTELWVKIFSGNSHRNKVHSSFLPVIPGENWFKTQVLNDRYCWNVFKLAWAVLHHSLLFLVFLPLFPFFPS